MCRSINSVAWKCWLLWSKWTLLSGRRKIRIWISKIARLGVVNFHCMQWACDLFLVMIEKTCHVHHFFDIWQWWSRPLNFRVFIHAYSLRPQTYFRSSLTHVLNQFGIWKKQVKSIDIEKVGSKKHLASKSVSFLVELISSSFLKATVSGFLFLQWLAYCPDPHWFRPCDN